MINPPRPKIGDLDSLPFMDRTLFKKLKEKYGFKIPASIGFSRGCLYNCNFCTVSVFESSQGKSKKYRMRTNDNILEEITYLNSKYGVSHFNFEDDSFAFGTKFYIDKIADLSKKILSLDFEITFTIFLRVDAVSYSLVSNLKKAGLKGIYIGVENVSQNGLDFFNKKITTETIYKKMDLLYNLGFSAALDADLRIMIGYINFFPIVTRQMLLKSYDFVTRYDVTIKLLQRTLKLYTGIPLINQLAQMGLLSDSDPSGWRYQIPLLKIIESYVIKFYDEVIVTRDKIRTIEKYVKSNSELSFQRDLTFFIVQRKLFDDLFSDYYKNIILNGHTRQDITEIYSEYKTKFSTQIKMIKLDDEIDAVYDILKINSVDLFRR